MCCLFNNLTENIEQTQDSRNLEMTANISLTNACQSDKTKEVIEAEQSEPKTVEVKTSTPMIVTEVTEKTQQMKPIPSSAVETASYSENSNIYDIE